ncbi:MAG: putative Ig domain-containing protein [Methylacidiphilales bacterium]|nr:putative Ig domain-containing protein [Candidatus Methylacidiphilales bacterium]
MQFLSRYGVILLAWAGTTLTGARAQDAPVSLTPPSPPTPQIHGPKVFGVHPGSPFLFTVAATGDRPMTFSADNLPTGLILDPATGRMTGTAPKAGEYTVILHAKNSEGEVARNLVIKAGPTLALTPPMGWNSWNCFGSAVSDAKVRAATDAMVKSGLINHGWIYMNTDGFWQNNPRSPDETLRGPERDAHGTILPNSRFPDMKALADYIHARGLKAGLYSSPGTVDCGGGTGSYQHEEQDARQFAAWGFDYLKYDWCSYRYIYKEEEGIDGMKKPYRVMAAALAKVNRDIVFSFCQYGMGDVWKWGAEAGGNLWRTTDDINDTWTSMISNAERQADLASYAGPGHWNDPDMLVVGRVGWGPQLRHTRLTPDEQYTHISLWCLQAAPLLIGCDLTRLDPFTLGLLTNDEVLDIDQDALGKAATVVEEADHKTSIQIWAKPLEDGSLAVGLVNLSDKPSGDDLVFGDFGLKGPQIVRDLWRQKDLGTFDQEFKSGLIPPHGVLLLRLRKP